MSYHNIFYNNVLIKMTLKQSINILQYNKLNWAIVKETFLKVNYRLIFTAYCSVFISIFAKEITFTENFI